MAGSARLPRPALLPRQEPLIRRGAGERAGWAECHQSTHGHIRAKTDNIRHVAEESSAFRRPEHRKPLWPMPLVPVPARMCPGPDTRMGARPYRRRVAAATVAMSSASSTDGSASRVGAA